METVKYILRRHKLEIIMVIPLVFYILGFTLVPVLQSVFLSFQDRITGNFPTPANYKLIIENPKFGDAFRNTLAITVIASNGVGGKEYHGSGNICLQ